MPIRSRIALFIFAAALAGQAVAQVTFLTPAEIAEQAEHKKIVAEMEWNSWPVGESFWYLPGEYVRAEFYRNLSTKTGGLLDRIVPSTLVQFEVVGYGLLSTNARGARTFYHKVRFDDGTIAYMDARAFGYDEYSLGRRAAIVDEQEGLHPNTIEFNSKLLADHPEILLAARRDREAAAAAKKEQERLAVIAREEEARALEQQRRLAAAKDYKRKGGVRIGMSKKQVLASNWGRPQDINRTTSALGVSEQWVYDGSYLYFENGVLKTIQN